MLKQANLSFSVTAQANGNETNAIQFSTQDKKTAKLIFTIKEGKKPLNLTDIDGEITLVMQDKSRFVGKAEVTKPLDGILEYTLTQEQIRHAGRAQGEIILKAVDGSSVGGFRFTFTIKKALIDEDLGPVKEFYIQDLEAVKEEVQKKAETINSGMLERATEVTSNLDRLEEEYQNKAYTVDEKLADVQTTVNDLRENGTGIDAQARQEVEQVNSQLADIHQQGVSCTQLGMTANDETRAKENFSKLTMALNEQKKILVDDIYYLDGISTEINKNVQIIGIKPNAKFFVKGAYYKLKPGVSNLTIREIEIESIQSNPITLFSSSDLMLIDSIDVDKNILKGNLSLLRWSSFKTTNPTQVTWGINKLNFSNNQVSNTRSSFFVLTDVPFKNYIVDNNIITNFDYVFLFSSISNDHSYPNEIFKSMGTVSMKNNKVNCTDEWWGFETANGMYYAFAITESQVAIYTDNHVEGMKTLANVSVYDAYLSSAYVEYKRNVWKNNICFHDQKENNTLMKAKGNGDTRYYENNTFIIEESFAEKFGKDKKLLKVDLFSCTSYMKRWVIKNNNIDVYFLVYSTSSQTIDEQWIENNVIKSVISVGSVLSFRVDNRNYKGLVHRLINNTIINSGEYDGTNSINLVRSQDYTSLSNLYPHIIVEGNTVIASNLLYVLYVVYAKKVSLTTNKIEVPYSMNVLNGGYGYSGYIEDLVTKENVFTKENGKVYENRSPVSRKIEEDYVIKESASNNTNSSFSFRTNNIFPEKYRYIREYEIISSSGLSRFSYIVDYFYDLTVGKNKISFTKATGETVTVACGEGEENTARIKLEGVVSGSIQVVLGNTSGNCYFYLDKLNDKYKTIRVKTNTAIV